MEACHQSIPLDFPRCNGKIVPGYLKLVSEFVSKHRSRHFYLKSGSGAVLTIAPVEDTEYTPAEVNGCGKFYLPTTVNMEVFGYVKGTHYPCDQLVLMTCEDQKVYGYDGDELHRVADDLIQMQDEGVAYPALESHYHGEAFKDMTKEDWEEVKQGPVGKRLDEEHRKLVASTKSALLKNLRIGRQKQRCHQQYGSSLPGSVLTQLQKNGT